MIKTVKGKVIAGTMAIGLLSSAGVALGATDAGTNLKSWYDKQFGQASANVESQYTGYQKDKYEGFDQVITNLKEYASNNINQVATTQINTKGTNIDKQKKEHIDAVNEKRKEIEGYMATEFKNLTDKATVEINSAAETAWKTAEEAMTDHTAAEGTAAQEKVKKELKATTATAVSELEKVINDAKNELQGQLNSKSTATVNDLKKIIDAKINKLSSDIERVTNRLLAYQYAYITTEAAAQEKIAKDAMQDLVNGINK